IRCPGLKSSELAKFRCVVAKILVQRIRIKNKTTALLRPDHHTTTVIVAETIKLPGICYRQRPQHHRINECKNRRIGTNAKRKRQHRNDGESWILPQHPRSKAQVPQEVFQPSPCPRFAAALPQIHRVPELPVRRVARLARVNSVGDKFLLLQLAVQPHLLFQLPRKLLAAHQHLHPPPQLTHRSFLFFPSPLSHSYRSATSGSTRVALRAGT